MRLPTPRRLVLKTRYFAGRVRGRLRSLVQPGQRRVQLENVQRRIELVLTAMYGRAIPIATAEEPGWNRERVRQMAKGSVRGADPVASMDGETIYLPDHISLRRGEEHPLSRFRLFAIEQAERIVRGTARLAPADPLARDLYLLREGVAIDAHIAESHPGLVDTLGAERRAVLADRPSLDGLTRSEREVELLLRDALAALPDGSESNDPVASRDWAEQTAERIRAAGGKYRGLPPVSVWGTLHSSWTPSSDLIDHTGQTKRGGDEDATPQEGTDGEAVDEPGQSPQRPELASEASEEQRASEATDEPEKRDGNAPSDRSGSRGAEMGDGNREARPEEKKEELPPAIYYDEWNGDRGAYVKNGAAVRLFPAEEGSDEWATQVLTQQASTVRQVRQQFERLRARRMLLTRQRAGAELDVTACVEAIVDRRIGDAPDDRLYLDARPARRGLAISLLVDVSGSTEERITKEWRIIDLEKIAVLLATQALDALGDLYAVYTFGGKSADNVAMTVVKDFGERSGETVQRRVAALAPNGFTRLGGAVRHATHQLARQSAGRRLLLLLSDGRPNDLDMYQGPYGVEDSRQAIFEARASGVYPFCLTIDREASEYLPRIFGQAGHTILQRPAQLPTALLRAVQTLIKR